jgi:serine/threonine kinase 16
LDADIESGNQSPLYAIKKIKIQLEEQEAAFQREVQNHGLVRQSHFVLQLIDYEFSRRSADIKEGLLVFPFYRRGTVQDMMNHAQATNEPIPFKTILQVFLDIGQGLLAFHRLQPPMAFRDLKPANVLISDNGQAVLMDLGSVAPANFTIQSRKEALELQDICAETCTAPYRPPEFFEVGSSATYDNRTDVWSWGCTLYAMAYGQSPFDGSATSAMSGKIIYPAMNPYKETGLAGMIAPLLKVDMKQRPFVGEVLAEIQPPK